MIAILIGLVIGLIGVTAMLRSYATLVSVAVPATRAAERDAQLTSTLLAIQTEMQQAGYGMTTPLTDNVKTTADGKKIVWRYTFASGGTQFCAGLEIDATGINYLSEIFPCAASIETTSWLPGQKRLLASADVFFEPPNSGADAVETRDFNVSAAKFTISNAECGPFGMKKPNRVRVELVDQTQVTPFVILSTCLTNI